MTNRRCSTAPPFSLSLSLSSHFISDMNENMQIVFDCWWSDEKATIQRKTYVTHLRVAFDSDLDDIEQALLNIYRNRCQKRIWIVNREQYKANLVDTQIYTTNKIIIFLNDPKNGWVYEIKWKATFWMNFFSLNWKMIGRGPIFSRTVYEVRNMLSLFIFKKMNKNWQLSNPINSY